MAEHEPIAEAAAFRRRPVEVKIDIEARVAARARGG
jgi:hypothetical protein